jgi:hypothetical protein
MRLFHLHLQINRIRQSLVQQLVHSGSQIQGKVVVCFIGFFGVSKGARGGAHMG